MRYKIYQHGKRMLTAILIAISIFLACGIPSVQAQDRPFITVWDTEEGFGSDNDQIVVPGTGTDYTIEWEEVGNPSNSGTETGTDEHTITFPNPGQYRLKISGDFTRIHFFDSNNWFEILRVEQWGDIEWNTMEEAFHSTSNLEIEANDTPDLSNVTSMRSMFEASAITAENSNIGSWDTETVTDMRSLFREADAFNQDISGWNTANVVQMFRMFRGADAFNQDLGSWNTGSVESMAEVFRGATAFNGQIDGWDTSNVVSMARMFLGATSFNQDLNGWETGQVTNMFAMFRGATSFNGAIGAWDTGRVTDMGDMFSSAISFNRAIGDWDTSSVERMEKMFNGATVFNQDIGGWETGSVTNMNRMFNSADAFNQDLQSWDTSSVTEMEKMFRNADNFNGDITTWNTEAVTSMYQMFMRAHAFNQDIGAWNTERVDDKREMFFFASSFDQNLGQWRVSGALTGMFDESGMSALNYDRTLIGWAGQDQAPNVPLGADGVEYCNSGAFRAHLIEAYNWSIMGDTRPSGCPTEEVGQGTITVNSDGTVEMGDSNIRIVFSGVDGEGRVTAAHFDDAPSNITGISEGNVSAYRLILVHEGSLSFDENTEVRFDVSALDGIETGSADDITVYYRSQPGEGEFLPRPTTYDAETNEIVARTSEFSEFVLASDTNPLPVELADFTATRSEQSVTVQWSTASETNNAGFEVQHTESTDKSTDSEASSWTTLGFVEGAGTTDEPQSYTFTAEDVSVGTHRFRLRQVDTNGIESFSEPVEVKVGLDEAYTLGNARPTPTRSQATLELAVQEAQSVTAEVYDVMGRRVRTVHNDKVPAEREVTLDVDARTLSSGTYFVRVKGEAFTATRRLTVVR